MRTVNTARDIAGGLVITALYVVALSPSKRNPFAAFLPLGRHGHSKARASAPGFAGPLSRLAMYRP